MIKHKKMLALVLALSMFFSILFPMSAQAQSVNQLTFEEAVHHTTRNSKGIRDVKTDRIKKIIERREAVESIKIIRKRERFPWFSLLMSINLPQKHMLPREIELLMKLPQINSDIQILREKEKYEKLLAKHDAQIAYMDVLLAQYAVQRSTTYINETKDALEKLRRQHRIGQADRKDVEYLEVELEAKQKDLQKNIQSLEKSLDSLSKMTNIKLNVNSKFVEYLPTAKLDRSHLSAITDHAVKNDFALKEAIHERKIAQTKVVELIAIYNGRWGGAVRPMTQYVENKIGRQAEKLDVRMDYEQFINSYYNPALNRIEAPWSGSFKFRILFITIRIPKEWFKLGTVAERYFDDEKYALFNALIERDKAIDMENDIREELIQQVKDTFFVLKQMESTAEEANNNLQRAKRNYEISLRENALGLLPFQELHSEKMSFYEQQDSQYEAKLDYGNIIAMFNLYTSGYLDLLSGSFQADSLADGDSFLFEGSDEAIWYIETVVTDYKFTFGVRIPESLEISHFELYTSNHVQIGEKTDINNTISHLPLMYEDSTMLYVLFYKDDDLLYKAKLDGFGISGPLVLEDGSGIEQPTVETPLTSGVWRITVENQFKAVFEMAIHQELIWDQYSLHSNELEDRMIGNQRVDAGRTISHLPSTLSEPENMLLKLYNSGTIIGEYKLSEVDNHAGVLIEVTN